MFEEVTALPTKNFSYTFKKENLYICYLILPALYTENKSLICVAQVDSNQIESILRCCSA